MKDSVFFNMNLALSQAMSISVRVSTVSLRCLLQDSAGGKGNRAKGQKPLGKDLTSIRSLLSWQHEITPWKEST